MKNLVLFFSLLLSTSTLFGQIEDAVVSTFVTRPGTLFEAITWTPDGRIFTVDFQTGKLFKYDSAGNETEVADFVGGLIGGAVDAEGNYYVCEFAVGKIHKITPDNEVTEYATGLNQPAGLLVDEENQLMYVAEYGADRISVIDMTAANPSSETLASGFPISGPDGLTFSPEGNIISANFDNNRVQTITPEGEVTTLAQVPGSANTGYIIPYADGYMTPGVNGHNLYTITYEGEVTKLCVPGGIGYVDGPLADSKFSSPNGIAISPSADSILVTESTTAGRIRLITFEEMLPSSAEEILSLTELTVSPNPTTEKLQVAFVSQAGGATEIILRDTRGAIVDSLFSGQINSGQFDQTYELKPGLSVGAYLLQIRVGGEVLSRKLILQ